MLLTGATFFLLLGVRLLVDAKRSGGEILNNWRRTSGFQARDERENRNVARFLGVGFVFFGVVSAFMAIALPLS